MTYESHPDGGDIPAVEVAAAPRGDDDGGLWVPEERLPPPKMEDVEWNAGGVGADGDASPSVSDKGVSSVAFVFLAVALGAIFAVWRKSNRRNRRNS